jgi:hypothetical protein
MASSVRGGTGVGPGANKNTFFIANTPYRKATCIKAKGYGSYNEKKFYL